MITENLQRKIDRAIRLLQSVQKRYDGEIEIAYSGGKDSDVILQLAKEAGIRYRAIYRNTTIDPPGTWGHVREMGVEILRAKAFFFHLVAQKGFPSRFSRFCCEKLKEYKVLDKSVIGVRKAESRKRNERYNEPTQCRYYGAKTEKNHVELIYPILEWTDEDVRDFIIDRKLKLAPIYYNGGANRRIETPWLYVLPSRLKAQAHYRVSEISQDSKGLSPCRATIYGRAS
jgi:phosphoadenosine phosphosulfate reductase